MQAAMPCGVRAAELKAENQLGGIIPSQLIAAWLTAPSPAPSMYVTLRTRETAIQHPLQR